MLRTDMVITNADLVRLAAEARAALPSGDVQVPAEVLLALVQDIERRRWTDKVTADPRGL